MTSHGPITTWAAATLRPGPPVLLPAILTPQHLWAEGFHDEPVAEPAGQVSDLVRPLPDGSRLHAHVLPDGLVSMHRDRWDPRSGPLSLVLHIALETQMGRVALAIIGATVVVRAVRALSA